MDSRNEKPHRVSGRRKRSDGAGDGGATQSRGGQQELSACKKLAGAAPKNNDGSNAGRQSLKHLLKQPPRLAPPAKPSSEQMDEFQKILPAFGHGRQQKQQQQPVQVQQSGTIHKIRFNNRRQQLLAGPASTIVADTLDLTGDDPIMQIRGPSHQYTLPLQPANLQQLQSQLNQQQHPRVLSKPMSLQQQQQQRQMQFQKQQQQLSHHPMGRPIVKGIGMPSYIPSAPNFHVHRMQQQPPQQLQHHVQWPAGGPSQQLPGTLQQQRLAAVHIWHQEQQLLMQQRQQEQLLMQQHHQEQQQLLQQRQIEQLQLQQLLQLQQQQQMQKMPVADQPHQQQQEMENMPCGDQQQPAAVSDLQKQQMKQQQLLKYQQQMRQHRRSAPMRQYRAQYQQVMEQLQQQDGQPDAVAGGSPPTAGGPKLPHARVWMLRKSANF